MENPFFHRLGGILWGGIVILIVVLAIYVSAGRLLTANLSAWHTDILQALNARGPFVVDAEHVSGEWQFFSPVIVLTGLRLNFPGSSGSPLVLSEGRISVDVLNSLRTGSLQLTHVVLVDLSLHGELGSNGSLRLQGLDEEGGENAEQLKEFFLNVEKVTLRNNRLMLTMPSGEERNLGLDLQLSRDGSDRRMEATLTSTRGAVISVLAQGIGDPFRPDLFSGQVYADIQSTDLGAVQEIVTDQVLPFWAEGSVDLQVWFDWDRGVPSMEIQLAGSDLLLAPKEASWQFPLDQFALQARLQREKNRWTLLVSDLQMVQGDVALKLPRLQLDAWNNTLRLRAADVALEPVSALVTQLEVVPKGLRDVFAGLNVRGSLSSVQLKVADIHAPADDWEIQARFEAVAVSSYKGAPGTSSANGYTQMAPGGGFVLLDSQMLTLDFPAIYHQPLHFEDLYGTVHLAWDADRVRLDSGLLTTQGEEGTAKVLFGLDIPLSPNDIGIEMDLLVGLKNAHPTHRVKYIPYILNPTLLTWLTDSIGEGVIEQGAFLWRGSLRKGSAPFRTVQLAFNVADTQLTYHPRWPPVLVNEGIVLIDDSTVSVWANRAGLFESTVESLSVETRVNAQGQIMLAVDGGVSGPAADGLKVLNESPLAGVVGQAFANWTVAGSLETDLELRMNLSDKTVAPQVHVSTRWQDVDMVVMPGNLPLKRVNGEFDYSTTNGFSARFLEAKLWGKKISAKLQQQHQTDAKNYDPATSVLDIELVSTVDMADVRRWLRLNMLEFANGQTEVEVSIRLAPGESPLLSVESSLRGVSLDFPQPWRKDESESLLLYLKMPLAAGSMPLSLSLGDALNFRLDVSDGQVHSGALGINVEPPATTEHALRVTGHAPLIQGDEWLDFVTKYFSGDEPLFSMESSSVTSAAVEIDSVLDSGDSESLTSKTQAPQLDIFIDVVQADTLVIREQELQSVGFNLAIEQALWNLSLDANWLRADLSLPRDGRPARLNIEYLDLDHLPQFKLSDGDRQSEWDLPLVEVTLSNMFQSGQRLGDLAFQLHGEGSEVTAQNITGQLADLRLPLEHPGRLVWHRGVKEYTQFQTRLSFEDLGKTLEYFGYQRIIETGGGDFELDLSWPGTPQAFTLREGQGSMQVDIGSGSFLEVPSGAAGALRVVSILNLADIVGRLSLSQMFESGIPFDSVNGEIYLHGGTLEVAHMDVKGGSSFQFSGVSDVETQSLGGELVATLPVANNLPWIAALAASLPVAAGVFVVSRIFNKQMNRLSSAIYTISGSWNDPEVDFDRVFDIRTQGTKDVESVGVGPTEGAATGAAGNETEAAVFNNPAPVQSVSP